MSQLAIFLDLDRTLYRTTAAGAAKWQKIGQLYPSVDGRAEYGRQSSFYRRSGDAYAYDFTKHISALGLDTVAAYDSLRSSELADGRFEHEGVNQLVTWAQSRGEVKVLTYGIDDYQRLKASLCPSLRDVEVVTTLGLKADYLRQQGSAWLVDDKPIGDSLPGNVRFIQACLEGQVVQAGSAWPVATSLLQVPGLMR